MGEKREREVNHHRGRQQGNSVWSQNVFTVGYGLILTKVGDCWNSAEPRCCVLTMD